MLEFILFSFLFGLAALSVYIITSNQNHQIRNQKAMISILSDIKRYVGDFPLPK